MQAYRERGLAGLRARKPAGRPPKLSAAQEREVRRWLREEWPRIKKVRGVGVRISS